MNARIRILMRVIPPEKYRPGKGCVYDPMGICATLITGWSITAPFVLECYGEEVQEPGVDGRAGADPV